VPEHAAPGRLPPGVLVVRVVGLLVAGAVLVTGSVAVQTDTGRITVEAAAAGSPLTVRRTDHWSFAEPATRQGLTDGTLTLDGGCAGGLDGLDLVGCSIDYHLSVPDGVALELTTGTGSLDVRGVDGRLRATTGTGSVRLTGLRSTTVRATSDTGSVLASFTRPPDAVRAASDTGSVEVVLPDDRTAYVVSATTSTGSTAITVPTDPRSRRTVEAEAGTGSVSVALAAP
jgi:hypothetical protein